MSTDRMDFISLCYISGELDSNGNPWLNRIADVEDGKLVPPRKSERPTKYFENRDQLYWSDGPSESGDIGIWSWNAVPRWGEPNRDYITSHYISDYSPIRIIVVPGTKTVEYIIEQLINGIPAKPYICDTLFCFERQWGTFCGVLCKIEDLIFSEKCIKLKDDVHSLPQYLFSAEDIYNWADKHLRFLENLYIGEPNCYVSVGGVDDVIRSIILNRITWRTYRETMNGTKKEWNNCKLLLERICTESIHEEVAREVACSLEQAKQAVTDFCSHANDLIDQGDLDSEILSQIVMCHDGLRSQCEGIAAEQWKREHQAEIELAQAQLQEVASKKSQIEREARDFQSQILSAQSQLEKLKTDIARYEALGNDTLQAVRMKISDAQSDMAGFIAELSMFLPQSAVIAPTESALCSYMTGISALEKDEPEICENWKEEFELLQGNLSFMAYDSEENRDLIKLLSAFLYAAYIEHTPLLMAGPFANEFADALSLSATGRSAGVLKLDGQCNLEECIRQLEATDDTVIVIQNMFCKNWDSTLPQALMRLKKFIIWTHPYVEDLLIEPKGLYNYALPVFTECFVETRPTEQFVPGIRSENFRQYQLQKSSSNGSKLLQHIGLSKLTANQLQMILSNASNMIERTNKDMEFLFAILPFAVLTGQKESFRESLNAEKNISGVVKEEIKRYLGED